jgi:hypothetical protein
MSKAEFNRKWAPIIANLKGLCKANRDAVVIPKRLTSSMPASTNLSPTPTPTSRH